MIKCEHCKSSAATKPRVWYENVGDQRVVGNLCDACWNYTLNWGEKRLIPAHCDLAVYNEILKVIEQRGRPIEFLDAVELAVKQNITASSYVGNQIDYDNLLLWPFIYKLKNEEGQVKIVYNEPLTFSWLGEKGDSRRPNWLDG